jgi:hypothetical protein
MVKFTKFDESLHDMKYGNIRKVSENYFIPIGILEESSMDKIYFQFNKITSPTTVDENTKVMDVRVSEDISELIREVEDLICEKTKENLDEWFPGKGLTESYIDTAFMTSLKKIKKTHDCIFKPRVSMDMIIFNEDKTEIDFSDLDADIKLNAIFHLAGIWFTNTRFGVTWKIEQLLVRNRKGSLTNGQYLFDSVSDDDEEDLDNVFPDE